MGTTTESVVQAMLDLMAEGGDLLLLYWCGHGVATFGARVLFTSNATDVLLANLPVDKIRSLLASGYGAGFPQQVLVFDACANHFEHLGYQGGLLPAPIPDIASRTGTKQFFYFATDVGRVAGYDRTAQQAAFSTEVIRWLESDHARALPADLDAMSRHVQGALAATGTPADGPPVPVTLVVQDFSGNGTDMVYGAGHTGLHASQIRLLQQVVVGGLPQTGAAFRNQVATALIQADAAGGPSGGVVTAELLGRAITTAFRSGRAEVAMAVMRSVAVTGGSPDELFVREVQLCWERQQRIAPLVRPLETATREQFRYAHALAVPAGARVVVYTLVEALDDAAQHLRPATGLAPLDLLVALLECQIGVHIVDSWFELDPQELSMLRAEAAHRLAAGNSRARLVVDFRSPAAGTPATTWPDIASYQLLHAGVWSEKQEIPCGPDDKHATAVVEQAVRWAGSQVSAFTVGLVVSRLLQGRIPEAWPIREEDDEDARPLGFRHPVVLHSAERMAARGRRRTSWTHRLATIRTQPASLDVEWLAAEACDPDTILVQVEGSHATCIGFGFTPGPAVLPLGQDPLIATVNGGAPYIAWFETEPAAWSRAREQAEWVVAGGALSDVADRLFALRRRGARTSDTGLRLLWDDDTELPRAAPLQGEQTLKTTAAASPIAAPEGP